MARGGWSSPWLCRVSPSLPPCVASPPAGRGDSAAAAAAGAVNPLGYFRKHLALQERIRRHHVIAARPLGRPARAETEVQALAGGQRLPKVLGVASQQGARQNVAIDALFHQVVGQAPQCVQAYVARLIAEPGNHRVPLDAALLLNFGQHAAPIRLVAEEFGQPQRNLHGSDLPPKIILQKRSPRKCYGVYSTIALMAQPSAGGTFSTKRSLSAAILPRAVAAGKATAPYRWRKWLLGKRLHLC